MESIQFFDDLSRALLGAFSAANALVLIDRCHEIIDRNGIHGAVFLADAAGNTANRALLSCGGAVFNRTAGNNIVARHGQNADDPLGADRRARAASAALVGIYHGNAVHDRDRVKLAGGNAGAKSHTSVGALLVASANLFCGDAIVRALVYVLIFCQYLRDYGDGNC